MRIRVTASLRHYAPFLACAAATVAACATHDAGAAAASGDPLSGGATTVFDTTSGAYGNSAANLSGDRLDAFNLGHSVFTRNWVTAPATTESMDGLGPLFNQRSCSACHSKDGRAPAFDAQHAMLGMLFRLSIPGSDAHGGPLGDPVYQGQLRPSGVLGVPADGTPRVVYHDVPGTFGDGTPYTLQEPTNVVENWNYGVPAAGLMIGPRVAPATIGLGLLEAIPESDIALGVRHGDVDGVAGHPNYVWDAYKKAIVIGRFGWKANVPTVLQQTAGAFAGDMGITSAAFPDEPCTSTKMACVAAPRGGSGAALELDDARLDAIAFYMRTLAVPARRNVNDATPLHGEQLFTSFGCASCHTTTFHTGAFPGVPEVEHQTIHPYTDLLVHDMGEGLADNRPDFQASGREWRTAPLWGIGLLQTVNGHEQLLHDARARGMVEAILWHGGEAERSKERFRTAAAADRDALVTFLRSL